MVVISSLLLIIALYCLMMLVFAMVLAVGHTPAQLNHSRKLSVLVAARNEATCIRDCLESLARQQYPPHLLDIHIGDDASDDDTARIIQDFIVNKPHFHYHHITETLPGQRGKQNVLAQLATHAQGEVFVITDADVIHPPHWLAMLSGAFVNDRVGIVTAPTLVQGRSFFTALQGLDWLTGISIIKAFNDLRLPVSPVGNNMAVTRQAYEATGGYANIPFSITEDYKLWEAVRPHGYRLRWLFSPHVLNRSRPIGSFRKLLQQRKRWFRGGQSGPKYAVAAFGLSALAHVALALSPIWLSGQQVLLLLAMKVLADLALLTVATGRLRRLHMLLVFLPYQIYLAINLIVYLLWFPLPGKVDWKGRKY